MTDNELTHAVIGAAIEVHRALGPGLLESAYEECLAKELQLRGISFERQKPLPVVYKDVKLECGYRVDLLVAGRVIVELKAVDALAPIHEAIVLTYLRMAGVRLGLLINFNVLVLRDGIRRFVYDSTPIGKKSINTENTEGQRTLRDAG
ncbi:MAG TPA: GxxExxY protein [Candidatus Nitrosotenuis sp.]|nr:GxxExxY protein [Candidatus Nitrosotenuis sp.]